MLVCPACKTHHPQYHANWCGGLYPFIEEPVPANVIHDFDTYAAFMSAEDAKEKSNNKAPKGPITFNNETNRWEVK